MCTRFYIEPDNPILKPLLQAAERSHLLPVFWAKDPAALVTQGEIVHGNIAAVLAPNSSGKRSVYPMKWGQKRNDLSCLYRVSLETAAEKGSFHKDFLNHRCIIPASYYLEQKHIKGRLGKVTLGDTYAIQPVGRTVTWICGLYRIEEGLPYFVILTKKASTELARINERMPLILPQDLIDKWLFPGSDPGELIKYALTEMIAEKLSGPGT